ncbi:Phosphatidylinositol-3,5-bisphosphate 3-phosphatase [Aphelenchoides fujianensis]|nr:Phosphatidylinositol-3,5-bisphosphate 3-phosphatase [Aphelenchoides fujianensis]
MPNRSSYTEALNQDVFRTISSDPNKNPLVDRRESKDDAAEWLLPGEEVKLKEEYVGYQSLRGKVYGSVWVTNYRLRFHELHKAYGYADDGVLDVPLGTISKITKMGRSKTSRKEDSYGISIKCKDMRTIVFYHNPENHSRRELFRQLRIYAFPNSNQLPFFATVYKQSFRNNGWKIYDAKAEFKRQGIPNDKVELHNDQHQLRLRAHLPGLRDWCCPERPSRWAKASSQPWENFGARSAFPRCRGTIAKRTWPSAGGAQPMVGIQAKRSSADETMLQMIRDANPHGKRLLIVDARPVVNARVNRATGGGYESDYQNCDFAFMNIENIHVVRDSLKRVKAACYPRIDMNNFTKTIEATGWLEHIQTIMRGARRVLSDLVDKQQSVFVHCSDGWDRTAQLTSLAMLQIDPYFRTLEGFIVLIEKEWCSFGHKFAHRIGHGEDKHGSGERSPIFVQFVDCVWQLFNQHSHAFEFNVQLLKTILDELYACRFGTFLYNSENERNLLQVKTSTQSIWSFVLENRADFVNPAYDRHSTADCRLFLGAEDKPIPTRLWVDYYGQYTSELSQSPSHRHDNGNTSTKLSY